MKKVLKWIAIVLGGLVILVIIVALTGVVLGNGRLLRTYKVQAEAITIPSDAASIAQGKHIVNSVCIGCHGNDLSGGVVMFDAPPLGHIESANLTPGQGGKGGAYTDANWILAIRHGIDEEGKSVLIMPSPMFYYFNDQDLADTIAYLKTIPPVDKEVPENTFTPFGKILIGFGQLNPLFSADNTDQTGHRPALVQPGVSVAYGDYIMTTRDCHGCHGPDLAGAKNVDPKGPFVPNLTPGGDLANWTEDNFLAAIKTGALPNGKTLTDAMPWKIYSTLTDDELKAAWMYIHSLPALPTTSH